MHNFILPSLLHGSSTSTLNHFHCFSSPTYKSSVPSAWLVLRYRWQYISTSFRTRFDPNLFLSLLQAMPDAENTLYARTCWAWMKVYYKFTESLCQFLVQEYSFSVVSCPECPTDNKDLTPNYLLSFGKVLIYGFLGKQCRYITVVSYVMWRV